MNRKVNYQEKIDLTLEELKTLLSQQKSLINRQKIQTLYWLKTGYSQSVTDVALRLGVHRTTVHRWLKQYSEEGLKKFLEIRLRPGRPRVIPPEVIRGIEHKLNQETTGFKSYKEIEKWVEENYQISRKYQTLHHQVRYRLQAKLKTPRRSSIKKNPLEETELKKNSKIS
ncbi:MAG: helix-turn-helix domain-containing protein [Limnoraphis sp. WC205]|nr:helix-turn-helix domain-containing protein [Limnoraphis sp. WC205]